MFWYIRVICKYSGFSIGYYKKLKIARKEITMEINVKAKPKQVLNAFKIKGENSDGSLNLISARHPEIKTFQMSRVGKYIYDRCNGSNTILDIIENIINDFNNVTYEKVRQDLFNILFSYWRIGFIEWDQNPYDYFYNTSHKDYQFKILTEDETTVILTKIKEQVEPNYDLKYDKKYALNEKRIKQSIYFNNEQYSCILENNDLKCLICMKSEYIKKTSVDLIVLF